MWTPCSALWALPALTLTHTHTAGGCQISSYSSWGRRAMPRLHGTDDPGARLPARSATPGGRGAGPGRQPPASAASSSPHTSPSPAWGPGARPGARAGPRPHNGGCVSGQQRRPAPGGRAVGPPLARHHAVNAHRGAAEVCCRQADRLGRLVSGTPGRAGVMMSLQSGAGSQASLWGLLPIITPAQHSCLPTLLAESRAPGITPRNTGARPGVTKQARSPGQSQPVTPDWRGVGHRVQAASHEPASRQVPL